MLPKPAFKYSEALHQAPLQFQNSGQLTPSTDSAKTVISCPECLTSFAVGQEVIAGVASPKFHCSRCDSVFSLSGVETPERTAPSRFTPEASLEPATKRPSPTRSSYSQSSIRASDFSIGTKSSSETTYPFDTPQAPKQSQSDRQPATARVGISLLGASSDEIEGDFAEEASDDRAPYGSAELPVEEASLPENAPSVTEKLFSGGFEITPATPPASKPRQTSTPKHIQPQHAAPRRSTPEQNAERIDDETFAQALAAQRGILQRAWHKLSLRNRSFLIMCAPLVALLASLISITPLASVSPHSIGALVETLATSIISSPVPQTPPSSLAIKDASLRYVKTRSHEVIAIVSGVLVNTSNSKISGVNLEALVFNRRGEVLATSRAQLRSALAKEDPAELNLETVRKFQGSLNARSASIAGGETVPFTIALLDDSSGSDEEPSQPLDLRQIKYFSARVFSVN